MPDQFIVDTLAPPSTDLRAKALASAGSGKAHGTLADEAGCFGRVRLRPPAAPRPSPSTVRVGAWNLERGGRSGAAADILQRAAVDICLLSEMDLGMARSGNADTTADLARLVDSGHAFATEFVELGLGDPRETRLFDGMTNEAGLHGNAVLTPFAVDDVVLVALDDGGLWFGKPDGQDQPRLGGRVALGVRHLLPRAVWFVTAHFESGLTPADRLRQTRTLLSAIDDRCGSDAVLIGGDFNCAGLSPDSMPGDAVLERPQTLEPMFDRLAAHGFDWRAANTPAPTTRRHPWHAGSRPPRKIDWFFSRGLHCSGPGVGPAVDEGGHGISDHELIVVDVNLA